MFERKMIQTSVEPAENKLFSSVDVNGTIYELAVWPNCVNRRASFVRQRQTVFCWARADWAPILTLETQKRNKQKRRRALVWI